MTIYMCLMNFVVKTKKSKALENFWMFILHMLCH